MVYTILTAFSLVVNTILLSIISKQKNKNQMHKIFVINILLLFIISSGLLLQILFSSTFNIPPIYFEYFAYIGVTLLPVSVLLTAIIFNNTKINFNNKKLLLLLIVPIISLLMLWTNDYHHLFFEHYSINTTEEVYGPFFYLHMYYTYACFFLAIILLIRGAIKNSGFFSVQVFLIFSGISIPLIFNILATLQIISTTIYITPISFVFAIFFFALAIFRFNFLSITPVTLQTIVNRISDGYLILNDDNLIVDYNRPFIEMFNLKKYNIRNVPFSQLLNTNINTQKNKNDFIEKIDIVRNEDKPFTTKLYFPHVNKYCSIEVNTLKNKSNNILGILLLFKDITQHEDDMKVIKDNQEKLIEQERLVSLGQMIGGVAHNMKTPIMSIGGAAEGLNDLIKEYELSIKDPEVTQEDHLEIAKEMKEWINKIKMHTSYMSDVITAVKGQAVTLSQNSENNFEIEELIKRVQVLMRHELKNAIITLNVINNLEPHFILYCNITGLVQVINNIISNAIQAYDGKTDQTIDLIINKKNNDIVFAIRDYGPGIPEKIKDKLFNEFVTTKGKKGTGLGLFFSASNIKAHYNGTITFESEKNKGTTFYITIPIQ